MKIVIEDNPAGRGGDLISIDRLLSSLQAYRESPQCLRKSTQFLTTLDLWIGYFSHIVNQYATLGPDNPPQEFVLPFEKVWRQVYHPENTT